MFERNVSRERTQRGVSTINARTVGKEEARAEVRMDPEADQVKASISRNSKRINGILPQEQA